MIEKYVGVIQEMYQSSRTMMKYAVSQQNGLTTSRTGTKPICLCHNHEKIDK